MSRPAVVVEHQPKHGSVASYCVGFALSIILTLFAYVLVSHHSLSKYAAVYSLATLAVTQFIVQLVFFLHLASESKPRWRLLVFGFMTLVVLILVYGSIWIMNNLNYHMMSPEELKVYMHQNEGL